MYGEYKLDRRPKIVYKQNTVRKTQIMMEQDLKPRERRHQRTKQAILDAAKEIITQKGIDGLSLRGIARAIDYSPAGLYEYFASKEDIICSVADEGHIRLRNRMAGVNVDQDPVEHLCQLGHAYLSFAEENPDYFILMFTTLPQFDLSERKDVGDMMGTESAFPVLISAVQRGVDLGVFKTREGFGVMEMAFSAWFEIHGLAMLRLTQLSKMPIDFAQLSEVMMRNSARGLTAE